MAQSLHQNYGHIVFSTKNRENSIPVKHELELYNNIKAIVEKQGARLLAMNGMSDHLHLIVRESKSVTDQEFIKKIKGSSSFWINKELNLRYKFAWQSGYGWFSVGACDLPRAIAYVQNQKEHHKKLSFQEEFTKFLKQYNIEYDERYLWD